MSNRNSDVKYRRLESKAEVYRAITVRRMASVLPAPREPEPNMRSKAASADMPRRFTPPIPREE